MNPPPPAEEKTRLARILQFLGSDRFTIGRTTIDLHHVNVLFTRTFALVGWAGMTWFSLQADFESSLKSRVVTFLTGLLLFAGAAVFGRVSSRSRYSALLSLSVILVFWLFIVATLLSIFLRWFGSFWGAYIAFTYVLGFSFGWQGRYPSEGKEMEPSSTASAPPVTQHEGAVKRLAERVGGVLSLGLWVVWSVVQFYWGAEQAGWLGGRRLLLAPILGLIIATGWLLGRWMRPHHRQWDKVTRRGIMIGSWPLIYLDKQGWWVYGAYTLLLAYEIGRTGTLSSLWQSASRGERLPTSAEPAPPNSAVPVRCQICGAEIEPLPAGLAGGGCSTCGRPTCFWHLDGKIRIALGLSGRPRHCVPCQRDAVIR